MENRILNKIMELLREQPTVSTGSTPGKPGFSSKSPAEGPTAGYDKPLKRKPLKRFISLGKGSRARWKPQRQVPKNILGNNESK